MPLKVTIVDYGTGNINSVKKCLDRIGISSIVSSDIKEIITADKIVLPGVGHFKKAMSNLRELNLLDALNHAVLIDLKPVLGICLGMELMGRESEEGNAKGLGWFDAKIVRFRPSETNKYKVPHTGWNQIRIRKNSPLMKNVPELSEFYFVHSYHLKIEDESDLLNETEYEIVFPSAVEKGNIFGVQYHPEKSHDVGIQLLRNFIKM